MKWLQRVAMLLALVGLVVVLAGVGFSFFLKNTKDGRALAVQWQLTRIFQGYGHGVAWDRVLYTRVSPYVEGEIWNWDGREQIRIYISNRLHTTRTALPPLTLIHVLEVVNAPQRKEPLFLFLFESPFQPGRDDPFKQRSYELSASLLTHQHGSLYHFHIGTAFAWGDLSTFPLERYFFFEEIEERQSWVEKTSRRALLWFSGVGGAGFLLGGGVLAWCYFPSVLHWVAGLMAAPLRWRPAYAMTGIPLNTAGERKENGGENVPNQDDVPYPEAKDASAREERLFFSCLLYLYERELEEARAAAKAERDALHRQVREIAERTGKQHPKMVELLKQFPRGTGRTDLRNARMLLRQARMIRAEGEVLARVSPAPVKSAADAASEEGPGFQEKALAATDAEVLETRRLYDFLEDIDPYIKEKGGDPLVAKTIILWGFLRPKRQDSFVAGNYGRMRHIRENVQRKGGEIERVFGRHLLPKEIEENFVLLKKGKVIIENDTHPGMIVCSLSDDEKAVGHPWCEVIRVINRARRELLLLRSGG